MASPASATPTRRQITPLAEASSRHSHRHVLLPFDLNDASVSLEQTDIRTALYNIFPGTFNVAEGPHLSFLLFQVEKLPETPWPLTVGGIPITIIDNTQGRALLFPRQRLVPSNIRICSQFANQTLSSGMVLRDLTREVNNYFLSHLPGVDLVEIIYAKNDAFYAILDNNVNIAANHMQLPSRFANRMVGYFLDEALKRPHWTEESPSTLDNSQLGSVMGIDDTPYETLRPGVLVYGRTMERNPAWIPMTTGALVESPTGNRFLTVATHLIGVALELWQIASRDELKSLGETFDDIPFTDISLVQLEAGINFSNEPFENSAGKATQFKRLFGEDPAIDRTVAGMCHLDSPYTGSMDGVVVMNSVRVQRNWRHPEEETKFVLYNWAYFGQVEGNPDKTRPSDETAGSAIWDDEGVIVGFHSFYLAEGPFAGCGAMVNASELVGAGYRLAK